MSVGQPNKDVLVWFYWQMFCKIDYLKFVILSMLSVA
jgi:hypothetical protein